MAGAIGMLAWFWALSRIPLAELFSLNFSSQLFAVVFAIWLLREPFVLSRWAALIVGFAGVLVILRPGVEGVSLGGLAILLSAFIWAGCRVDSKVITRYDSPATLVAWQTILLSVFTLPAAIPVWVAPDIFQLSWLILIAGLGTLSQIAMNWAIKLGDIAVIEPVAYFRLVWAALVGLLVFAEVPELLTILGAALVLGSVIYIIQRERTETATTTQPAEMTS